MQLLVYLQEHILRYFLSIFGRPAYTAYQYKDHALVFVYQSGISPNIALQRAMYFKVVLCQGTPLSLTF
jgi:hypothetical protein